MIPRVVAVLLVPLLPGCAWLRARRKEKKRRGDEAWIVELSRLNRAILESAGEAIYGVGVDGITTFANSATARMTGWDIEELIGRPVYGMFHHTRPDGKACPSEECSLCSASRDGLVCQRDNEIFWRKDGSSFPVAYTSTPLLGGDRLLGAVVVFRDISERKKRELEERERSSQLELEVGRRTKKLHEDNARLNAILNAPALVSVIATDPDGLITMFNAGSEKMLGYRAEELVGKQTPAVFHLPAEVEARAVELTGPFGPIVKGFEVFVASARCGHPEEREWTYVRKDGTTFPGRLGVTAVRDETGDLIGFLGISYDITERKLQEAKLETAKRAAESASGAKSEFLAAMSHEIRTPMNGILGMAGLLLNSDLNAQQRKRTEILRDSAEGLLAVLNEILDFSRIEAGKLELENVDFDLRNVVEGVADLMAVKSHEKGLQMVCFIDPEVPTKFSGDPSRLRQVLVNLVGNAVKFTHAGHVSLRVELDKPGSETVVRFTIADTGIGVPADKRHLLFQWFSQVDASTARQYGGTGLGLSIVRGLVDMMGGRVDFDSEEGKGSVFWFTVKLSRQPALERPGSLSLAGKRILIADNNAASRGVIMELLTYWKCDAVEIENGAAAIARLRDGNAGRFDAAIVDLAVTGGGSQLAKTIRDDPRIPPLPLILMTPPGQTTDDPERWRSQGFAGYVTKPVKQGELGASLASVLGYKPLAAPPDSGNGEHRVDRIHARSRHRLLLVEDNPGNQEVAMAILDQLGYTADLVPDGLSALNALSSTSYALVLTDCQLPGIDGYELTRLIRNSNTNVFNHRIPIIAVTAHALPSDREKCLAAGMDDYIAKPIRPALIEEVLARWIVGKPEGQVAAPPVHAALLPRPAIDFDEADLLERVMGNENLARRVAARFVDDMPKQLAALAEAVSRADAQTTRCVAHGIKGSAANVGGMPLSDIASRLERFGDAGDMESADGILPELSLSFDKLKPRLRQFCDSADPAK